MDDFIYVLLFVGWIAYSIFSAVQKKKQKELKKKPAPEQFPMPEVIEPEKPTRSVFEEIFGEGQFGKFEESHERFMKKLNAGHSFICAKKLIMIQIP